MEITFVWSWLSFWVGAASTLVGLFVVLLLVAFNQFKKKRATDRFAEEVFGSGASDFFKS
jgi:hypothetical protein